MINFQVRLFDLSASVSELEVQMKELEDLQGQLSVVEVSLVKVWRMRKLNFFHFQYYKGEVCLCVFYICIKNPLTSWTIDSPLQYMSLGQGLIYSCGR